MMLPSSPRASALRIVPVATPRDAAVIVRASW